MAIWLISPPSHTAPPEQEEGAFLFDAAGLPDLARAESVERIREWLREALPQAVPEHVNARADYLWTLSHAVGENDSILVQSHSLQYMLGELTAPYRHPPHHLPVRWIDTGLAMPRTQAFAAQLPPATIIELTDADMLGELHRAIPAMRRRGPTIFRWIGIITLLSELAYFWPR